MRNYKILMNKIVIADSGPLIAFARINYLAILTKTLGKVIIPKTVADECLFDMKKPGACNINHAIQKHVIQIYLDEPLNKNLELLEILDAGEAAAIALALKLNAGLLIDEKPGRHIAKKLNLRIIGTAGILLLAKEKQLIVEIAPVIETLKRAGYFFSSPLTQEVLKRAKERLD